MAQAGPLLVFDGDCGFCTTAARAIERRWHVEPLPRAVPWQRLDEGVAEAHGLSSAELGSAAWWLDGDGAERAERAVARALIAAGGFDAMAGRTLLRSPFTQIAARAYRLVARHRHRLPGGSPACRV